MADVDEEECTESTQLENEQTEVCTLFEVCTQLRILRGRAEGLSPKLFPQKSKAVYFTEESTHRSCSFEKLLRRYSTEKNIFSVGLSIIFLN